LAEQPAQLGVTNCARNNGRFTRREKHEQDSMLLGALAMMSTVAFAAGPEKVVRYVIPFPPGLVT
jgi:hypothetical protein